MIEITDMDVPEGKIFLDTITEFIEGMYADKDSIAITPMFYHKDSNKIQMLRILPLITKVLDSLRGQKRIEADIKIKGIMLAAMFHYVKTQNPDEYIFASEMFVKKADLTKRTVEEVKNEYKSGDAMKDPNSREGVMLHHESVDSYVSRLYLLERKYEQGRVLVLQSEMTSEDENPEPGGNFVNILYKPENNPHYGVN